MNVNTIMKNKKHIPKKAKKEKKSEKKKKENKEKNIKNCENNKCSTCNHEKIYHQGISGVCFHPECKCYKFRLNPKKETKCQTSLK